ncbi:hypothetical protein MVEN_01934200 [Mycena venus]|uniref:Uncharacterized protein n=1 Tax=Mycena venus TaxID=2733690 RepID=A0A8H6XFJ7_9AGAR|nr:hypothetical protein MVEN_01934200 [Mycena venus]
MLCLWLASVLSLFQLTVGAIVNTTVDDQYGSPDGNKILYLPETGWLQGGIGNCDNCPPPPVSDFAYMNTFHGSLFNQKNHQNTNKTPPTATLVFFGSSVSVNCILSNALSNPAGTSDMTFTIDGIQTGTFPHIPSGNPNFQASTVFLSSPLQLGNHTLVIQNGRTGGGSSLVILDSITYSFDDLSTTSAFTEPSASATSTGLPSSIGGAAKSSNTAAIAGGVIAALAVILLILLAFLYIRYRRNQHRSNVPLSTSIFSPIGRIGRLLSAVQSPPKPPPDMAPVPFPSPAHHISHSPSPRPPAPAPAAPASPPGSRMSRISFNANLLVGRFQRRPPPPAILTRHAPGTLPNTRPSVPPSPAPPSGNPLLRPPSAQPEPNNVVASIQQWQQRTLEETANEPIPIIHPLDMSEVDLSSHYDESSISSPPPPPAPPPRTPQPPQRRFTVMNN